MRDDKGRFAEGNEGRPKGSVNKSSNEIREAFQMLLEDNLPTLKRDISSLEPKERVKFMLDLATFIIPKMKSVQVNDTSEETIEINFNEEINWTSSDVIDFEEK
jgi:hypothetical protein